MRLREAPFLSGGKGDHRASWEREISEDIVRYWHVETVEDVLDHLEEVEERFKVAKPPPPPEKK